MPSCILWSFLYARPLCSLDTVEIINAFEEEFDVTIPDHEAEKMWTIGDAAKFIAQNHH